MNVWDPIAGVMFLLFFFVSGAGIMILLLKSATGRWPWGPDPGVTRRREFDARIVAELGAVGKTPYEIGRAMEARTGQRVGAGSLVTSLHRLERLGNIRVGRREADGRRVYMSVERSPEASDERRGRIETR